MTLEQFETIDTQLSAVEGGVNVANEYGSSYWGTFHIVKMVSMLHHIHTFVEKKEENNSC
ncbi:hypothetical protein AB3331_06050 [Streptococcus sp. H49]|uniref:hypothetical protein n=1 Tax=Streptococcus huangxiaojuni TaxID=3237239 RepID=UPI0034A47EE8